MIAYLQRRAEQNLRKQNRRQSLAAGNRGLVGRAPGLEELHELLARAVVVPLAVALDDFHQLIDRLRALAAGVERHRKIEAGLMVERIGLDLLLELADRADRVRLLGNLERGAGGRDRRIVAFGLRHLGENLLGLLDLLGRDISAGEARER